MKGQIVFEIMLLYVWFINSIEGDSKTTIDILLPSWKVNADPQALRANKSGGKKHWIQIKTIQYVTRHLNVHNIHFKESEMTPLNLAYLW